MIKIGTSSCILGNNVRYNSGNCLSKKVLELKDDYEFIAVCPEVEIGLGVPRPTLRLIEDIEDIGKNRIVLSKNGEDYSDIMREYGIKKVNELKKQGINGFILKSKSPSCGLRVKVYKTFESKGSSNKGVGLFANILKNTWNELPLIEEGMLNDVVLREKFIISTDCHYDWNTNVDKKNIHSLIDFHERHKYLLESLNQKKRQELGRLIANQSKLRNVFESYYKIFFKTLNESKFTIDKIKHTYKKIFDRLYKEFDFISKEDKIEFYTYLEKMSLGKIEKIVPKVFLKYYVRKTSNSYLKNQKFLLK